MQSGSLSAVSSVTSVGGSTAFGPSPIEKSAIELDAVGHVELARPPSGEEARWLPSRGPSAFFKPPQAEISERHNFERAGSPSDAVLNMKGPYRRNDAEDRWYVAAVIYSALRYILHFMNLQPMQSFFFSFSVHSRPVAICFESSCACNGLPGCYILMICMTPSPVLFFSFYSFVFFSQFQAFWTGPRITLHRNQHQ